MKITAVSSDDYLSKAGQFEHDLRELDKLIKRHAPHLTPEFFQSGMFSGIGYGVLPYQTKSMKEPGRWPILALAAQKNYMALYASALGDSGAYIAEEYGDRLGKASIGKSCIRFKRLNDLNEKALIDLLRQLDEHYMSGRGLF